MAEEISFLIILVITGLLGGFTRAITQKSGVVDLPKWLRSESKSKIIAVDFGFLQFVWGGIIASVIAGGLSIATNNILGLIALGLISGYGSVYFFDKLQETKISRDSTTKLAKALSNDLDILEERKQTLEEIHSKMGKDR